MRGYMIAFAVADFSLGVTAACLWYRASTIKMATNLMPDGEHLRRATLRNCKWRWRLNKRAALWTAIAAIVAAVGEAIGEVA
jgi:hypothetical protein